MASFVGKEIAVSNVTATLISAAAGSSKLVALRNHDGANSVFIGGDATVTINGGANPGYEVKAGETYGPTTIAPGLSIYGLAKTAAVTLDVTEEQL